MSKDYPAAAKWLNDNLIPEREAEFREALDMCFDTNEKKFSHKDISMYLKNGFDSIFTSPEMSGAIKTAGRSAADCGRRMLTRQATWEHIRPRSRGISTM